MNCKSLLLIIGLSIIQLSCWKYRNIDPGGIDDNTQKVMGYKPVYGAETAAKTILYDQVPRAVVSGGNIYAYHNFIFQAETGYGIHVIDNTVPANAHRIGFINVKGCAQISIKGDKLY